MWILLGIHGRRGQRRRKHMSVGRRRGPAHVAPPVPVVARVDRDAADIVAELGLVSLHDGTADCYDDADDDEAADTRRQEHDEVGLRADGFIVQKISCNTVILFNMLKFNENNICLFFVLYFLALFELTFISFILCTKYNLSLNSLHYRNFTNLCMYSLLH